MQYSTRTTHSSAYYLRLIQALIGQLKQQASDKAIADHLNNEAILTATGQQWKPGDVKAALHKIRNYEAKPSKLHQALLQLCFNQVLHVAETLVLFAPRRAGVM